MDYELQDHEFEKISRLVYDISGIALHEGKKEMVRTRLIKTPQETATSALSRITIGM